MKQIKPLKYKLLLGIGFLLLLNSAVLAQSSDLRRDTWRDPRRGGLTLICSSTPGTLYEICEENEHYKILLDRNNGTVTIVLSTGESFTFRNAAELARAIGN